MWSYLRRVPMWQQSGTLLFGSCHGIVRFLVDESQIRIWRHFLEVLPEMTLIFFFKKNKSSLRKMRFNIDGRKVGHFLITIQKPFKLIIN